MITFEMGVRIVDCILSAILIYLFITKVEIVIEKEEDKTND
jgi:hypothetical protein